MRWLHPERPTAPNGSIDPHEQAAEADRDLKVSRWLADAVEFDQSVASGDVAGFESMRAEVTAVVQDLAVEAETESGKKYIAFLQDHRQIFAAEVGTDSLPSQIAGAIIMSPYRDMSNH